MEIIVCAKHSIDVSEIKIDPETNNPILKGVPRKISDFDKNAVEEAIKIKEKLGGKITVFTLGPSESKEGVMELLAMGADEAFILNDPAFENVDSHGIATALSMGIKKLEKFDLVLCGEASIDAFSSQVGPRIAELLGIPQVTNVRKTSAESDRITTEMEAENMIVEIESKYPTLITVTKEINEPRLPNMMQILQAQSKKVEEWNSGAIGFSRESLNGEDGKMIKVEKTSGISMDRRRIILEGEPEEAAEKLVNELKSHVGV